MAWPGSAWLLLSFSLFPVRHPVLQHLNHFSLAVFGGQGDMHYWPINYAMLRESHYQLPTRLSMICRPYIQIFLCVSHLHKSTHICDVLHATCNPRKMENRDRRSGSVMFWRTKASVSEFAVPVTKRESLPSHGHGWWTSPTYWWTYAFSGMGFVSWALALVSELNWY